MKQFSIRSDDVKDERSVFSQVVDDQKMNEFLPKVLDCTRVSSSGKEIAKTLVALFMS